MRFDNIECLLAYSRVAEVDTLATTATGNPAGWSKYRSRVLPRAVKTALKDFRFKEGYSDDVAEDDYGRGIFISDLFVPIPRNRGLRGDPYLWGKMAAYFYAWPLTQGTDIQAMFIEAFQALTGEDFQRQSGDFFNKGLAHGGMSSGHVSIDWWRETGLPILVDRYRRIRAALPEE